MLLVCLAAVFSAGLNLVGRFAVAAATPIVLNLSMIAALGIGFWQAWGPAQIVIALAAGVLMGGLLQLLLPAGDLYRQGWRPARSADPGGAPRSGGEGSALGALWALFLPGLLGAAILQINILVSRLLAFGLEESAVSVLYLASRLMELPLGVFTIAVATVFFPALSAACSREDATGFAQAFLQGLRLVVVFSVPAGVGLAVLGGPILETLFLWGAFQAEDVTATLPLLAIYALGLPFYSVATFATRGLHAHKDMRTPVRVAAIALGINLVASLILMQLLGVLGLALANVLSAVGQSLLLWRALAEGRPLIRFAALRPSLLKVLGAGAIMGLGCAALAAILEATLAAPKLVAGLTVLLGVPAGAAAYFCLLSLLRFEEMDAVRRLLRRRLGLSSE
jgi:putative peptidoglycan lipid II flippase